VRPANTHLPTLTRPAGPPPLIGQNATCISNVNTDWTNLPTSLKVEWLRDSSVVQTDANQMGDGTGLVTSTYQIGTADRTHTISCRVSATNVFGTTLTPTPATLTIPMPALPGVVNAPTYTVLDAPANTNTIALNDTATCVSDPVADWEPDATGGLTYLWTQAGAPTSDTTNTYTFTAADRGKAVVCHVTATNDSGTGQAAGPALTLPNPPTIGNPSPTFFDASTSATQTYQLNGVGSWNGSPTNYSVTWSSDTSGTPGGPLGTCSGATPGDVATCRYALGSGDVAGTTITMHVIATNRGGDSGEVTAQRTVPNAPLNSVAPTLSGSASPMTLDPGTWSNSPTFFTVTFTSDQGALANNPGGTCSGPDVSSCNYAPDPATESGIATITAHVTAYNAGGPSSTLDASALAP
jgi:hypothetical protein